MDVSDHYFRCSRHETHIGQRSHRTNGLRARTSGPTIHQCQKNVSNIHMNNTQMHPDAFAAKNKSIRISRND